MIGFLAEKAANFLAANNIIEQGEKPVYKYGAENYSVNLFRICSHTDSRSGQPQYYRKRYIFAVFRFNPDLFGRVSRRHIPEMQSDIHQHICHDSACKKCHAA